ncbi:MAG: hypothetical protein GXO32_03350 [Crenarchaeota archaeon]|nr:hypothetical protein [Thermoproteota archaeon]
MFLAAVTLDAVPIKAARVEKTIALRPGDTVPVIGMVYRGTVGSSAIFSDSSGGELRLHLGGSREVSSISGAGS